MTDISRMSRRTAAVVRDAVGARPALSLATAGFLAASVTVVAGGRVGLPQSVIPLTNWLGLFSAPGFAHGDYLPGELMLAGIIALLVLWLVAIRLHHSNSCTERHVWWIAGAWSVPFIIGPPMLSNDVWTYSAQGLMVRNGLDPYSVGPAALGNVPALAAVDPYWRSSPSPYGPLATTVQHLASAISGGNPLGAAIVFRALAVVCLIAIGLLAADLADQRRVQALTLTILNPLLLLHIVSGAHLDGVMCALLLGALVAVHQWRWPLAVVLACAAGSVKAPGFVAVLAIIVLHNQSFRGLLAWRVAARDISLAVLSTVGFTVIVHDGWGWVQALNTPGLGHTALAPASLIGDLYHPIVTAASPDDLATGGRITTMLAAVCIVVYLSATAHRRTLASTIGYGLLAVGLLGPVLYPWYLMWGVVCLAPTARGARRDWIVLISGCACVFNPPGFSRAISIGLSVIAVAIALLLITPRALGRRPAGAPSALSISAGG